MFLMGSYEICCLYNFNVVHFIRCNKLDCLLLRHATTFQKLFKNRNIISISNITFNCENFSLRRVPEVTGGKTFLDTKHDLTD